MDDEGGSYDRKWDSDIKRFRGEFDRLQRAAQQCVENFLCFFFSPVNAP